MAVATHNTQEALEARISKVGTLNIVATASADSSTAATQNIDGEQIYRSACFVCHDSGITNAPILGDTTSWETRSTKGLEALIQSAINGIGAMPSKGGRVDLSDDAVAAAVEFMMQELE